MPGGFTEGVLHATMRSLGVAPGPLAAATEAAQPLTGAEAISSLLGDVGQDDDNGLGGSAPAPLSSPPRQQQQPSPEASLRAPSAPSVPASKPAASAAAAPTVAPGVPVVDGPHLEVIKGQEVVARVPIKIGAGLVFGRMPENDVRLDHPSSSRRHALLRAMQVRARRISLLCSSVLSQPRVLCDHR